ncbi:predicted protein [Chaetomium globosum CBS 148.51]|uniref:Uncharacterized protein n=1 Tax=Chaetomium globosum (strain ATCC 6205 / CBS 148.51 / DSM 1962 / NBRC 6347 / NRRL 1970) TaxID=306901 RepID=Q2H800_CHAGB|nr:uncharacterized protein CHGG_03654 [Chaetomium globosum CBS 148.51]EAQ91719.1 predicted protein [Chaetomium globosum CBS 148.51]
MPLWNDRHLITYLRAELEKEIQRMDDEDPGMGTPIELEFAPMDTKLLPEWLDSATASPPAMNPCPGSSLPVINPPRFILQDTDFVEHGIKGAAIHIYQAQESAIQPNNMTWLCSLVWDNKGFNALNWHSRTTLPASSSLLWTV